MKPRVSRRSVVAGALASAAATNLKAQTSTRPNVLLVTTDDLAARTIDTFGNHNLGLMPTVEAFAQSSYVFHQGHVVISECWPSRTSIFTGRVPHRHGTTTFKPMDPDVTTLPQLLKSAGYRTGVFCKTDHSLPDKHEVFDVVKPSRTMFGGRSPKVYKKSCIEFIQGAQANNQPFFLNVNIVDPHRPFAGSPPETGLKEKVQSLVRQPIHALGLEDEFPGLAYMGHPDVSSDEAVAAAEAFIPPFLPDTPEVRSEMAAYYTSCKRADRSFAAILEAVALTHVMDNTIIVFMTDNGMHLPFAKANVYAHSTLAGLMISWPGAGLVANHDYDHFVRSVDLMPTILELANIEVPGALDGASLTSIMSGLSDDKRATAATYRYQFPMRAIHDRDYSYIYNHWHDGQTEFQDFFMNNPSARAVMRKDPQTGAVGERGKLLLYRTREELFKSSDVYSMTNLAQEPQSSEILKLYRAKILEEMRQTDDNMVWEFEKTLMSI